MALDPLGHVRIAVSDYAVFFADPDGIKLEVAYY